MTNNDLDRKIRFKAAFKALDIDRQIVADQLGYKKKYLDQVLSAKKNVSELLVNRFTKRYKKFSAEWILTGKGEMVIDPANEVSEPSVEYILKPERTTDALRKILEDYDERITRLEKEVMLLKGVTK